MRISDKDINRVNGSGTGVLSGGSGLIDAAAVVLAGGRGKRAGGAKVFLSVEGRCLILEVLGRALSIFREGILSCRSEDEDLVSRLLQSFPERDRVRTVTDRVEGLGPLEGLAVGLSSAGRDWSFVIGCDMPLFQESVVRLMWSRRKDDRDAVIARVGGYLEPLHAFYHKRCYSAVEAAISRSRHKISSFFDDISPVIVEEGELSHIPGYRRSFMNINTPGDINLWLEDSPGRS
ncbi:MAG: putative molybdenum cofactor guanylyltransferase [Synergistales bacterium 58_81]|nr:MAG: putative molybdenum cofactor guanylyltransferase [Synergistales bacterium 58_81]HCP07699.1 hypothetical protein [Synergistaceae bacterium]